MAALLVAGCESFSPTSPTEPSNPQGAHIDCGPLVDLALCHSAVATAMTVMINPPPLVSAIVRHPRAGDACLTSVRRCTPDAILVELQSGDVMQTVRVFRTDNGWITEASIR